MRRCIAAVVIGLSTSALAQELTDVGVLPSERTRTAIADKERNPFGKQETKTAEKATVDNASEESLIRQAISAMSIVGRTKGTQGWKVLLDNLILEPGNPIPPVIEGQTEMLRVAAIYEGAVEIEWVEAETVGEPRRMFIPIDLSPRVRSALGTPQDDTRKTSTPPSR